MQLAEPRSCAVAAAEHALRPAVLFAMGGYGTYLGWQIRAGNGGDPTFGTPDTAADLHPKLMAGA